MLRVVVLLALLALFAPAVAAADTPERKTLYNDGPTGRYLLGGDWLFRLDPQDRGIKQRLMRSASRSGWSTVKVPNAWNAGDDSEASMAGSVGWYRKDFELPSAAEALDWIVRFESANYRTRVWLNGRPLGENVGAYLPFEFQLAGVKRRGTNRLVVRVDSRRKGWDFPPSGLNADGQQTGGWWNYGGLLREVYVRRVDAVDWAEVAAQPTLPCSTCDATVKVSALMRNVTSRPRRVRVTGTFGRQKVDLGSATIPARSSRLFSDGITVRSPKLWSPAAPNRYTLKLRSSVAGAAGGSYTVKTGIRSVRVSPSGRLQLNGQDVNFRGIGYHEDDRQNGFAVDNEFREWLVRETKAVGATLMRTHYPSHPRLLELADELGVMVWSEIPVYGMKTEHLTKAEVRRAGVELMRRNVVNSQNHPSIITWSVGNELSARPGPAQGAYLRAAANMAKALDPTRPVSYAVAAYPSAGCQTEYAPIDILGFNEYFGWYPGPGGQIFDRTRLSAYLDGVRACYPTKAVVVSEFGAEANREGPVEEKGTWAHQQDFVNYHLGVYATKPWLSGAAYWALNEFRVRPAWEGGNPRPNSPFHQKGLITYDRQRKPAWTDVQRWFTQTPQLVPAN